MKHLVAIALLCLPTQLSAAERCNMSRANRDEVARVAPAKAPATRVEVVRPQKARSVIAWRVLLLEPQIL